jgi:mandelate racemase
MSDMPSIKGVRLTPVQVPLSRPMRTASGTLPGASLCLIDVETDAGVTGTSYIFTYTPKMLAAVHALHGDVGSMFVDGLLDPAAQFTRFQATFRLLGIQGLLGMYFAGVEQAMWDAQGKIAGKSVAELLGGEEKPIRAYDSFGFIDPKQDLPLVEASVKAGFKAVKVKLGVSGFEDDLASVAATRTLIGPDVALMLDYNQSLDTATAIEYAKRLAEYNIYWLEEPVPAEDLAGHARVRAESPIKVQTGENWWHPAGARLAIDAGASDYVMPDMMKIGGYTGWMAVAHMAEAAGLPVSSHAFVEVSAHALAATPGAHWLEYLDKARPLLKQAYDAVDGMVTPRGPGLGIEWDPRKVAEFKV